MQSLVTNSEVLRNYLHKGIMKSLGIPKVRVYGEKHFAQEDSKTARIDIFTYLSDPSFDPNFLNETQDSLIPEELNPYEKKEFVTFNGLPNILELGTIETADTIQSRIWVAPNLTTVVLQGPREGHLVRDTDPNYKVHTTLRLYPSQSSAEQACNSLVSIEQRLPTTVLIPRQLPKRKLVPIQGFNLF